MRTASYFHVHIHTYFPKCVGSIYIRNAGDKKPDNKLKGVVSEI